MSDQDSTEYGISTPKHDIMIKAPHLDYLPQLPQDLNTPIGLIGAGGISEYHLKAYKKAGLNVAAIANRNLEKAKSRCNEFFPNATTHSNYHDILNNHKIKVIDVTTHVDTRTNIIADCLKAGKHVLSQKPLVTDLTDAEKLIQTAKENNVLLAVNQNGRWAPHFSYIRNAIASGIIGEITSVDFSLQWDQTWIANLKQYEEMKHLILHDFGIHWFDILTTFFPDQKPTKIYASATKSLKQDYQPPSLAAAIISYPHAQATISFNAHTKLGEEDVTTIIGSKGTLRSRGPGLNEQPKIELFLENGNAQVDLKGNWFSNGFLGTMCELLCAIEQNRQPSNSAKNAIPGLQLCFAAVKSAETGEAISPHKVTHLFKK